MKQNKPSFHNLCVLVLSVLCLVIFSGCMADDPLPKVPIPPNAKPAGEKWVRLGTYMSPETFPKTWSLWLSLVRKVDDATKETKNVYDVYYYHNHDQSPAYGHGCRAVSYTHLDVYKRQVSHIPAFLIILLASNRLAKGRNEFFLVKIPLLHKIYESIFWNPALSL